MTDPFDDIALSAAINVLRDTIESGKMPSGLPLPADSAELHEKAAAHLEATRSTLGGTFASDPAGDGRDVQISARLSLSEAWALAQFLQRAGFSEFRALAETEEEAYGMRDASGRVRQALIDAGFAPR